jgi:hypothetical protein
MTTATDYDNRDLREVIRYLEAEKEALQRRVKELEEARWTEAHECCLERIR